MVTFNTWLLEILGIDIAEDIPERRECIVEALIELDADVVFLQEVWPDKHRDFLIEHLSKHYHYCAFDDSKSGLFKLFADGLIIFSKHPIENYPSQGCAKPSHTLRFSEYTRSDEAFISKGAIHVKIHHSDLGVIDVYNAHLGALDFDGEQQNGYNSEHDRAVRKQANEFIYFVRNTRTINSSQTILAMDLNRHFKVWLDGFDSHDILGREYQSILLNFGAIDTFMQANGLDPRTTSGIYTYDARSNPNAAGYVFAGNPQIFVDYIFSIGELLQPIESRIIFTEPFDGYYLSDHYGLMTSFEIVSNP